MKRRNEMLAQERQKIIVEMLSEQPIIKTVDIVKKFNITNLTARRDLDALRVQGIVRRIYGGAVLLPTAGSFPEEESSKHSQNPMKKRMQEIGRLAASLVEPGDTVFLGSGSLTLETAKKLQKTPDLTFITNSMTIANSLMESNNKIYMLGGLIDPYEQNIYSHSAMEMMENFFPTKTILSCGGITVQHGVSMDYEPVAHMGSISVKNSAKTILVTRSRTFGTDALNKVCDLSDIYAIVTDDNLTQEYREEMDKAGVKMYYAETQDRKVG